MAISALLTEDSSGEGLKRQLQAKWEKNRQELADILGDLFGRNGLQQGKAEILRAGDPNPLNCLSWHQFRADLAQAVGAAYAKEVHVRNMNLNSMRNEEYLGRKMLTDIIQKILDFDGNPAYQNDLLGENDTSEPAAIIDGIFLANNLFIERPKPKGWDIRRLEDTTGAVRDVLELIHSEFTKRRVQPFTVADLRKTLMAPPYGLPPVSHALFAAVALRHEQKRILWLIKGRSQPFAESLSNAFAADSKYQTQLEDFSREQRAILTLLGLTLPPAFQTSEPKQAASNLAMFVKALPESVKTSAQLSAAARALVEFMGQPRTAHAIADFLCPQTPLATEIPNVNNSYDCTETRHWLEDLFESFTKARHAKYDELYREVENLLREEFAHADRAVVLANLATAKEPWAAAAGRLLEAGQLGPAVLEGWARAAVERSIEDCDDKAMGVLLERLRQIIRQHQYSPEDAHRQRLAAFLAEVWGGAAGALAEWRRTDDGPRLAALSAALAQPDAAALDGLAQAFADRPLAACVAADLLAIEHALVGQRKALDATLSHRQRLAESAATALAAAPDRAVLRQNLRGDGQPLALALLPLLDGDAPFPPEALDALAAEGLKKPLVHCAAADIEQLAGRIGDLTRQHHEDRDPRRQLAADLRAVVAKHKDLGQSQERLLEVLQIIVKELQVGRL
ncbi:MAG: hypothetical protein ACKN9T_14115 [Candidatus Methylumidiphilus sp.]